MAYCKLCHTEQYVKCQSFDVKILLDNIWHHYSDLSVGIAGPIILIMMLACVCAGEIDLSKWKYMWLEKCVSLLSNHVCRRNFPKHSVCFGRNNAVNVWQPAILLKMPPLVIYKMRLYHMLLLPVFSKIPNTISNIKSNAGITFITEWSSKLPETLANENVNAGTQQFIVKTANASHNHNTIV